MTKTILIVDDDALICTEISKELKRNFFSVNFANSGKEALWILEHNKIDIVLLDIFIQDVTEFELLEKIKKYWPQIEVIVITGYSSHEIAIQSIRFGAIDYLEKPINFDDLNTSLGRAIEKIIEKSDLEYKHTILLADDDNELIVTLSRILKKEGYKVFTANNGKDGLEICRNNKIDIIIADIEMPIVSGIVLLEKVKEVQKDIEVIMMTGFGDEGQAIEALRKGAINYLRKPIDLDELLIDIKKAIERILLYRNQLYRNRELVINTQIMAKVNEELEKRIVERTNEISHIQTQLFQTSKLATLGEVAAGLAHELNQPLTGISLCNTNIKKLSERDLLTQLDIVESVNNIDRLVKRMNKIIMHIRTFARQDLLKFEKMNVNESVENAHDLMREQLRLKNIEVVKELDGNIPFVMGETYQIEQVIINIISNAKDSICEKESILMSEQSTNPKQINIKTFLKNNWVFIEITDSGCGMTKEVMSKVFQPFFTTKEVGKATGLGLAISFGIIQNHNGIIDIDSKEGHGTTISIKLQPIKECEVDE